MAKPPPKLGVDGPGPVSGVCQVFRPAEAGEGQIGHDVDDVYLR